MEKTIALYSSQYYIPLIPQILSLICLFLIKKRNDHPEFRLFQIYALCYFLMYPLLIFSYFLNTPEAINLRIFENWDNLFTIIELYVYIKYIHNFLTRTQKKVVFILLCGFLFLFLFLTIKGNIDGPLKQSTKSIIYTIQSAILIVTCLFYYANLFRNSPSFKLKSEPSFWLTTGLFCMLTAMLPFSIAENYLINNYPETWMILSMINSLLYSLNFITIMKAYKCSIDSQGNHSYPISVADYKDEFTKT